MLERLECNRSELVNVCCNSDAALSWSAVAAHLGQVILSLRSYNPAGDLLVQLVCGLQLCLLESVVLSAKSTAGRASSEPGPDISDAILEGIVPLLCKVEDLAPADGV